jgi:hypothetical protein
LITILTPLIIDGYKSILDEAIKLCKDNGEMDKYLMTFQNFISRIPKWNQTIIETERKRICDKSGCSYLEDLVTCVHIIQLKILTAMRVGQKQKKVDIKVPKLDDFVHKTYINVARKIYKNVYLFEINIPPLNIQKNHRELEIIVQECILNTLRESIPVEAILKAYMDETIEEDVVEEIKEQIIEQPQKQEQSQKPQVVEVNTTDTTGGNKVGFNDIDYVASSDGKFQNVVVPKTYENLDYISNMRAEQRKQDEANDSDDDNIRINISDESVSPESLGLLSIEEPKMDLLPDLLLDEIEVLE